MKEYTLNKQESLNVMDMVQDALDRGMVAGHYQTDTVEKIIAENTNEFDLYNKDVEFEIVIRVRGGINENL